MAIRFAGRLKDDDGTAIEGASQNVDIYAEGDTATSLAGDTTDSSGEFDISYATDGAYDLKLTHPSSKYWWWNARDEVQVKTVQIWNGDANEYALSVVRAEDAASVEVAEFQGNRATPAAGDAAYFSLKLSDSAGNQDEFVRFSWVAVDETTTTEDGRLDIGVIANASLGTVLSVDSALLDVKDGVVLELNELARWDTAGAATTAAAYQFGRDDGNVMHANVPTGATFEWSVNDVAEMTLSATALGLGANTITTTGDITGGGIHVTGDTAAGDRAALGYTGTEGLVLTGQGSSTDVTIKNDADGTVISIATGTTTVTFAGAVTANGGTVTIGTVDINGGTVDGISSLTSSGDLDIGAHDFRAATLTADGLTAGRVVFAGASGLLSDDADMTFATDTLTVTKLGAFELTGKLTAGGTEIEGSAFDINGGTIDGVSSLTVADGGGFVVGHTGLITVGDNAKAQIIGTGTGDTDLYMLAYSTNAAVAPEMRFIKSHHGTVGSHGAVVNNELLGSIRFFGDDATDSDTLIAEIVAYVDDATLETGHIGGELLFRTSTEGDSGAVTTALTISNAQKATFTGVVVLTDTTDAGTGGTTGSIQTEGGIASKLNINTAANLDVEGYAAFGNGIALTADATVAIDRDFTTSSEGKQLWIRGDTTIAISDVAHGLYNDPSFTPHSSGTHGIVTGAYFRVQGAGAIPNNGATITTLATVYIADAPSFAGTITNGPYALVVDAGDSRFDGKIISDDTTNATSGTTGAIQTDGGVGIAEDLYCAKALNTPDGMGADGEQLTSGGDNVAMDWAAAGSLREFKNIGETLNPQKALSAILSAPARLFTYRRETEGGGHAITTGDYETTYAGVMADEAPWVMHQHGRIFSPVSAFGYTVAAFRAMQDEIDDLKAQLAAA